MLIKVTPVFENGSSEVFFKEIRLKPHYFFMRGSKEAFLPEFLKAVMIVAYFLLIAGNVSDAQPLGDFDLDASLSRAFAFLQKIREASVIMIDPGKREHPAYPGAERMDGTSAFFIQENAFVPVSLFPEYRQQYVVDQGYLDVLQRKKIVKAFSKAFFQPVHVPSVKGDAAFSVAAAVRTAVAVSAS